MARKYRELRLISDLHLEFGKFKPKTIKNSDKEQIIILAGDIGERGTARQLVEQLCGMFHAVIYVPGNHEYYGGEFNGVNDYWKEREAEIDNLHFLLDQTVNIDGIRFIGATLWTCLNKDDWFCKHSAKRMNDYRVIKIDDNPVPGISRHGNVPGRALTMEDTMKMHDYSKQYIECILQSEWDGKTVVVTHHSPTHAVTHPRYHGDPLNGAFHGHLDYIIEKYDIDYWLHGHTHDTHDLEMYGTHVVCNPRGYMGYEDTGFNLDYIIKF